MAELDKSMYYNAKPSIIEAARLLRERMTRSEKILWERLNRKQIMGLRFRRQHPIDIFIADFYCHRVKLVIDIDGEMHNFQRNYDFGRSAEMEKFDIKVVRFTNEEVEFETDKVMSVIGKIINERI